MKTIGIIGAMPVELQGIQNAQKDAEKHEFAGFTFMESIHGGNKLVTVCSGIGKAHAAMCTQLLIDKFAVDCIINTGTAGGMKDGIKQLEIVISTSVLPHDLNQHFLVDYAPYRGEFDADPALRQLAKDVCAEMGFRSYEGRIVSGDIYLTDAAVKTQLVEQYDPYAIDMETAAVGQCAWRNNVPFVSVRCIADLADDNVQMSAEEFEERSALLVADIVMRMCEK